MGKKTARAPTRISHAAIGAAPPRRPAQDASLWTIAQPPPGVVPDGAPTMAQDSAIQMAMDWGAQNYQTVAPYIGGASLYAGFYAFPGFPYLAALAQQSEYRRGYETLAREMTRKWIKIKAKGSAKKSARIKRLDVALVRFGVQHKFRRLLELDGLFGRSHLYIDMGDVDNAIPMLDDTRLLRKGFLKDLTVVEPTWCYPSQYNATNPLRPDFYRPTSWYVMGKVVDATRFMTIIGRPVPDLLKAAYSFGGVSLVQLLQVAVNNFTRTRQSVSDLVHSFSTMVLETDLSSAQNGGNGNELAARAQLYNAYRDNSGLFVVNSTAPTSNGVPEKLYNVAAPLGTLDALQAQAQEQQAAVIGCPLVVLLGYTPAGLNTSAEDQIRMWYDYTHATQENTVREPLDRVIRLIQINEFGAVDDDIGWDFEPLYQLDEAQAAAVQKTKADTFAVLLNGVVGPDDVQEALKQDEGSPFYGMNLEPPPEPLDDGDGDDAVASGTAGEAPGESRKEERDEA